MNMPQTKPIRVMLICDHQIVAWGFERLVQSTHPRLELACATADCTTAAQMLVTTPIDVILIDLDGSNGVETIAPLSALSEAKILTLTGSRDIALRDSAVVAGARGVVAKSEPAESLVKAIEKVPERRTVDRPLRDMPNFPATRREENFAVRNCRPAENQHPDAA